MADDEHLRTASFLPEDDEHDDHHRVQYSLSRLSVCSNYGDEDDDEDAADNGENYDNVYDGTAAGISRLSVEETGDDADDEPSDSGKFPRRGGERLLDLISSDSDKESGIHSLPSTPPRRRRRRKLSSSGGGGAVVDSPVTGGKAYASENEVEKGKGGKSRGRRRRVKGGYPPPWVGGGGYGGGESDHGSGSGGGGGGGVVVVARPIGGGRALCMGLEEVKACKQLGFDLEPGRVSFSVGSPTLDTSSGGNSPVATGRISSPGDDPTEVKARLKAWAQAVAFVSTSQHPFS